MEIYQVENNFYTNYDQAFLMAKKLSVGVITQELIESSQEVEFDHSNEEISIEFENGEKYIVDVELKKVIEYDLDDNPYNDLEIEEISINLGNGKSIVLEEDGTKFKSNEFLTPDLIKEIEHKADLCRSYKQEEENNNTDLLSDLIKNKEK